MKQNHKILTLIVCFLISLSFMSCMKTENWYQLKSDEFGFEVDFPGKPNQKKTENGEVKMNIFSFHDSKNKNLICMVSYMEIPDFDSSINPDKLPEFYRNIIEFAVNNVAGTLISETNIYLDKFEGREIKVSINEGKSIVKLRAILVENKLYQISTIIESQYSQNESIPKFMNSFKLLK